GTFGNLRSAIDELRAQGRSVSHCHFEMINPLPHGVSKIFKNFKKIVVCELNTGQFAGYLRMNFPEFEYTQFNKVQGLPFTTVELKNKFNELLDK
ncbi:MAG: 2-oxoacid:acceptor oxidoreductase subunit alpha, partial [Mucinivorans sp.]